jgi:type II secretory pathway pseudopilin PulG
MPQVKQAPKQKRRTKAAVSALGAAGLTFSLLGSATASAVPTADVAQTTALAPNEAITLGEEEIADTSLATFYVFDKEKVGSGVQVARRGCGGFRGCAVRASGGGGGGGGGCGGCGCACHTAQL